METEPNFSEDLKSLMKDIMYKGKSISYIGDGKYAVAGIKCESLTEAMNLIDYVLLDGGKCLGESIERGKKL